MDRYKKGDNSGNYTHTSTVVRVLIWGLSDFLAPRKAPSAAPFADLSRPFAET